MNPKIFLKTNYKEVLDYFIERHKSIRGYRTKLSKAAKCSSAYLSQVMNSHVQLSPDQGILLAEFWSLTDLETEFFLSLINYERAGTPHLRNYLEKKITELRKQHSNVGHSVEAKGTLSPEHASEYYSSWLYQAVHVAISVPQFDSIAKISSRFSCSKERIADILHRLITMGLIVENPSGGWKTTSVHTHVDRNSPNFANQHRSWRLKICEDQSIQSPESVLYSGVYSLNKETADAIRVLLLDTISETHSKVVDSDEEEVFALQIDWYKP